MYSEFLACKQTGIHASFDNAKAVEATILNVEITKRLQVSYSEINKNKSHKGGHKSESRPQGCSICSNCHQGKLDESSKDCKAKALKLFTSLLLNEARQPWEKIIKTQVTDFLRKMYLESLMLRLTSASCFKLNMVLI